MIFSFQATFVGYGLIFIHFKTYTAKSAIDNPTRCVNPDRENRFINQILHQPEILFTGKRFLVVHVVIIYMPAMSKVKTTALATLRLNSNCLLRMWCSSLFQSLSSKSLKAVITPYPLHYSRINFPWKEHDMHTDSRLYRTCSGYLQVKAQK